ncbi:unnamed protein product [Arctia plantaginis]|uniref:Homeobox domain-containing protein n=1 Tax=Arctia plantaginis TaxID=874455 RepID=A0A8S1AD25_ARCPL|nr:unnamed protein product [Arctia plantaginis]CAB3246801.1 unnamed protein product [Arctia plantaginis]
MMSTAQIRSTWRRKLFGVLFIFGFPGELVWFQNRRTKWRKKHAAEMATAKRKQEELGEECDDQEPHDNDCSDEEEAKRPRLDIHQHLHHQLPHRQ